MKEFRFKKGDVVRCIDRSGHIGDLTLDKIYTIVEDGGGAAITNDRNRQCEYLAWRFALVKAALPSPISEKLDLGPIQFHIGEKTFRKIAGKLTDASTFGDVCRLLAELPAETREPYYGRR